MTAIPKRQYVRSKVLLRLVADLPCQLCGSCESVQAAHSNWGGGKGRGIKADDNLVAALCMHCHHEIDAGHGMTKGQRQAAWTAAHIKTVAEIVAAGKWPNDVPIPENI